MTLNPQVGFTVISGGVPEGLGKPYFDSLIRHLERIGLYGVPSDDTNYFRRRIGYGNPDGLDASVCMIVASRARAFVSAPSTTEILLVLTSSFYSNIAGCVYICCHTEIAAPIAPVATPNRPHST